jgi:hypothetical protein
MSESNPSAIKENKFSWFDLSNRSAVDVENIVRAVPDYVTAQPLGSVRLLVDFTGASFNQEGLRAMKECAVFDKL